jgi:hypothetical protein
MLDEDVGGLLEAVELFIRQRVEAMFNVEC